MCLGVFCDYLVCLFVCLHISSACEPEWVVARSSPHSVCLHLSELFLGVFHPRVDCVSLCICVLVCYWEFGHWMCGRVGTIKDLFNPPFPVLKAGHSVSYSYMVCLEWVSGVGFFLFYLKIPLVFMYINHLVGIEPWYVVNCIYYVVCLLHNWTFAVGIAIITCIWASNYHCHDHGVLAYGLTNVLFTNSWPKLVARATLPIFFKSSHMHWALYTCICGRILWHNHDVQKGNKPEFAIMIFTTEVWFGFCKLSAC